MASLERVIAFSTGSFAAPRGLMVGGEPLLSAGVPVRYPFLCFAIGFDDASWVLVDAGVDRSCTPPNAARDLVMGLLAATDVAPDAYHSSRLRALGIERARVRAVIQTHLDFDHTGGLPGLAGVPVYIDAAEWRYASAPGWRERLTDRFQLSRFATTLVRREPAYAPRAEVPLERGAFALPEGEGAVHVVPLHGHTPGHCGVLVTLDQEGPGGAPRRLLLSGDACIAAEQVTERAPPGPLMHGVAIDLPGLLRTLDALRRWRAQEPSLRVVPSHDPTVGARCAAGHAVLWDRARSLAATATAR